MNYTATASRILKTIQKNGKAIKIVRPGSATGWVQSYDPAKLQDKWTHAGENTGDPDIVVYVDPATDTENAAYAVEDGYKADEIDGTMVQQDDRRYWVPASGLSEPRTIDRLTDGSDSLAIISCKRIAPGSVVLLYEVQCRG